MSLMGLVAASGLEPTDLRIMRPSLYT